MSDQINAEDILKFAQKKWGVKELDRISAKLAEECGEVCGACVKYFEGRADYEDIQDEIGDVLFVLSQLTALTRDQFSLDELLRRRIENRHPSFNSTIKQD